MMEETRTEHPGPAMEPQKEHEWLQRLEGEWTFRVEMEDGSGEGSQEFHGRETIRPLGKLWVVAESAGEVPGGGTASSMMILGYDSEKGEFVGTFVSSMMAHLWVYKGGQLDEAGRVLSLYAEGPDMTTPGKMSLYRDEIEWKDENRRTLSSFIQTADNQWTRFMTAHYERQG